MNWNNKYKLKLDLMTIFSSIVLFSITFTYIYNAFVKGSYLLNDFRYYRWIEDHSRHIIGLASGTYPDFWCVFPPFAYLIYSFFLHSDPTIISGMDYKNISIETYHLYYFFAIIQLVAFALIIFEFFKNESLKKRVLLTFAFVFSYPMFYVTIYQGNNILTTVLMLTISMIVINYTKEFDNNKLTINKIICMLFIAFSAGLKIVPAIFGIEFIRKKQYKNAILLVVLGLIVFILPFFYFDGLNTMSKYIDVMRTQLITDLPATGIFYYLHIIFLKIFHIDIVEKTIIIKIIQVAFVIINLFLYFNANKNWQRMMILSFICYAVIPRSFIYYILYYFIGALFFLHDENINLSIINIAYVFLFSLLFSLYLFHFTEGVHFLISIIIMIILYCDIILNKIRRN